MSSSNILVVMTDDHGQWLAGTYGNDEVKTPTMDHLAQTGVRMDNAFCPSPVCSPARASFFTGRLPSQHGIHEAIYDWDEEFQRDWLTDEITLPELLSDVGYTTGFTGKWHCGRGHEEEVFDYASNTRYESPEIPTSSLAHDRRATDSAIEFLREERSDGPFFLFVGMTATHGPWEVEPERIVEQYRGSSFDDIPDDTADRYHQWGVRDYYVLNDEQEGLAQMYAAAHGIDEQLSRLVDELNDQGVLDETLVVYTADHGHACGHHGFWGKGPATAPQNMVEESIRVPLIIGGYRGLNTRQGTDRLRPRPGRPRTEFVDHCDTFQTLLEFAGVDPPTDRQYPGDSYLPQIVRDENSPDWEQVQICDFGNVRAARGERYKLVRRYREEPDLLFDLEADPRETTNIIDRPEHADALEELSQTLENTFDTYADPDKDGKDPDSIPPHNPYEAWDRTYHGGPNQ